MDYVRIRGAAAAAFVCLAWGSAALAAPIDQAEILTAHNKYRAMVGTPPLTWSARLADGAQKWAEQMAALGRLKHSGAEGVGENLAFATAGHMTLTQLIDIWGGEKRLFKPGTFPDISTNGNWRDVGHYTQIVWRDTREVGCAVAIGGGNEYLVCQYGPQGNIMGERAY
jgi:hypothetical protein